MEDVYYWVGLVFFWGSAIGGASFAIMFLTKIVLDQLGRFKIFGVMVEFAYYRKEFTEWVKDKKRIKLKK